MAGNARNKPPISGSKRFAMSPANTVTTSPNAKRTRYSYHRDCLNPEVTYLQPAKADILLAAAEELGRILNGLIA